MDPDSREGLKRCAINCFVFSLFFFCLLAFEPDDVIFLLFLFLFVALPCALGIRQRQLWHQQQALQQQQRRELEAYMAQRRAHDPTLQAVPNVDDVWRHMPLVFAENEHGQTVAVGFPLEHAIPPQAAPAEQNGEEGGAEGVNKDAAEVYGCGFYREAQPGERPNHEVVEVPIAEESGHDPKSPHDRTGEAEGEGRHEREECHAADGAAAAGGDVHPAPFGAAVPLPAAQYPWPGSHTVAVRMEGVEEPAASATNVKKD